MRSTITKGKAEEVESAIQYALATRERQLDIGFMFLHNRATGNEYSDNPVFHLVRSTPWAVTDDMKIGALEGLIDSLRRLVIERTRIKGEPS
ncbi:hypothetical protein C9I56_37455 [Paraburkholderia caribensis]|uniref:Uncharacterized protein n=1 Tax=Paraburkholderia caribensis TaxID=75105 RepID=A0A9Q6S7D8_9BURK|nr:hypothetical protein C9I56_37455 [Paraburkholderia caribensis]QLB65504.1 hypothetical protein A9O66_24315 [Paraburkholderia caribensis]